MKIVLISDTHGLHSKMAHPMPEGDVLIHAGDFTNVGSLPDVARFDQWMGSLDYKHKIVIAGNHERGWDKTERSLSNNLLNAHYLEDSSINIDGVNFYGSPWTPTFGWDWAFNVDRGDAIRGKWDMIPDAGLVDVLITHGPPKGIRDQSVPPNSECVGCDDLFHQVMISQPKVHVFGHIHGGYGKTQFGEGTIFVNAAICDEDYRPVNAPIVVEFKGTK